MSPRSSKDPKKESSSRDLKTTFANLIPGYDTTAGANARSSTAGVPPAISDAKPAEAKKSALKSLGRSVKFGMNDPAVAEAAAATGTPLTPKAGAAAAPAPSIRIEEPAAKSTAAPAASTTEKREMMQKSESTSSAMKTTTDRPALLIKERSENSSVSSSARTSLGVSTPTSLQRASDSGKPDSARLSDSGTPKAPRPANAKFAFVGGGPAPGPDAKPAAAGGISATVTPRRLTLRTDASGGGARIDDAQKQAKANYSKDRRQLTTSYRPMIR